MVRELCTQSRATTTSSERDDSSLTAAAGDPRGSMTEAHFVEQMRDALAAHIRKRVWNDREARKLLYTDDEVSEPEVTEGALSHLEASREMLEQLDADLDRPTWHREGGDLEESVGIKR